jgi:hypothetical protein
MLRRTQRGSCVTLTSRRRAPQGIESDAFYDEVDQRHLDFAGIDQAQLNLFVTVVTYG